MDQQEYICITQSCFSRVGEQIKDNAQSANWFWLIVQDHQQATVGRIGPFCSHTCAQAFRWPRNATIQDEPAYTRIQWERLQFHRHRAEKDHRNVERTTQTLESVLGGLEGELAALPIAPDSAG